MQGYLDLMRHVREQGVYKADRTGTGTYSVFGYQMRFDLQQGFPLSSRLKSSICARLFMSCSGSLRATPILPT